MSTERSWAKRRVVFLASTNFPPAVRSGAKWGLSSITTRISPGVGGTKPASKSAAPFTCPKSPVGLLLVLKEISSLNLPYASRGQALDFDRQGRRPSDPYGH
jgi:hypothetical protein